MNTNPTQAERKTLVGIDTGGTFTDFVVCAAGRLRHCKVLSSPDDPSRAICEGLDRLGLIDEAVVIVHGTTVGTNAVLEGKGARVAYVTSTGFADTLTLARQDRQEVYNLQQPAQPAPVPGELCFEIGSRINARGQLVSRAGDDELEQLAHKLQEERVEAVAINLLFSFLCPDEEQRIRQALEKLPGDDLFITCSSDVLPEIREFERGVATWLNAAVGPVIGRYLERLERRLPRASISVMQSSGTTVKADRAAEKAVHLLLSGPAGGIAAARLAGATIGQPRMITLDMGGTSTDVSLMEGSIPLTTQATIGRWPLNVSSVDIHTIGAGGGSVARVDEGGMLLVGPESAGADPGPACYGRGGLQATVTDANLVLGRIPQSVLLGGYLELDCDAARQAIDRLARELGVSRMETAMGVVRLANEHMARALRVISVERGHDPRDYTLVCFGGAGGLHACDLADLLDIHAVMLPALGGVLSALGMLASEPGREMSLAVLEPINQLTAQSLESSFEQMEREALSQLEEEGMKPREVRFERRLELRYAGQSGGKVLPYMPGTDHALTFHRVHEEENGHRLDAEVEVSILRLSAKAPAPLKSLGKNNQAPAQPEQKIYMQELKTTVAVLDRHCLDSTAPLCGPAIIIDKAATAWLPAGWSAKPDAWGNLHLIKNPP